MTHEAFTCTHSALFTWGQRSLCHLRVFERAGAVVAIATELDENPGGSTVNTAEALFAAVAREFAGELPLRLILYFPDPGEARDTHPYIEVTIASGRAEYERKTPAAVEGELGCALPEQPRLSAAEAAHLAQLRQRELEEAERVMASERAAFCVLELARLPSTPAGFARRYGDLDWRLLARAAIEIFESGVDPLDREAIMARTDALGGSAFQSTMLASLFRSPITVSLDAGSYTDGMHRTAALRAAGVERCVAQVFGEIAS